MENRIPIFVFGSARSGTTWLANLLDSHSEIAAITCVEHHGIHESHLFDHTRYCFPQSLACTEFLERYREEDYFKLLDIDAGIFCAKHSASGSVFFWFRKLMDAYAEKLGAEYWLEKTPKHLVYYDEIIREFPDAVFVCIERDFRATLLSNLTKYARAGVGKYRQIAEKVLRYGLDKKAMRRLNKSMPERLILIHYEDLCRETNKEIARIEQFLKIEQTPLVSRYKADSSYKKDRDVYKMTSADWLVAYVMRGIEAMMPFELELALRKKRDRKMSAMFPMFTRVKET